MPYGLTPRQYRIMNYLWSIDYPVALNNIYEAVKDCYLSDKINTKRMICKALSVLKDKELVKSEGNRRCTVYYVACSRYEFMLKFKSSSKPLSNSVSVKKVQTIQKNRILLQLIGRKINSGDFKTNAVGTLLSDSLFNEFKECCKYLDMNNSELLRVAIYVICEMVKKDIDNYEQ